MTHSSSRTAAWRGPLTAPTTGISTTSVLLFLALACWPFIQLGLSFWVSFATLAALLVVAAFARPIARASAQGFVFIVVVVPLMYLSVAANPSTFLDVLKVSREAVFFTLLLCVLIASRELKSSMWTRALLILIAAIAASELALTIVQAIGIPRHIFVTLPRDLFIQNQNTLPELLDLIYSRIRPSGTFAEPSYLGFVALSIAFAVSPLINRSPLAMLAFVCAIGAGLMSQSAAFVLASAATLPYALFASGVIKATRRSLTIISAFLVVIIVIGLPVVQDRFSSDSGEMDVSAHARIVLPFTIMGEYLSEHPAGAPYSEMMPTIVSLAGTDDYAELPIHNAIFNSMFSYGIGGIFIIATIVALAPNNAVRLYIVSASYFNGALFSVDKFAIASLAIIFFSATAVRALAPVRLMRPKGR